jgi:hypothetical protein
VLVVQLFCHTERGLIWLQMTLKQRSSSEKGHLAMFSEGKLCKPFLPTAPEMQNYEPFPSRDRRPDWETAARVFDSKTRQCHFSMRQETRKRPLTLMEGPDPSASSVQGGQSEREGCSHQDH